MPKAPEPGKPLSTFEFEGAAAPGVHPNEGWVSWHWRRAGLGIPQLCGSCAVMQSWSEGPALVRDGTQAASCNASRALSNWNRMPKPHAFAGKTARLTAEIFRLLTVLAVHVRRSDSRCCRP